MKIGIEVGGTFTDIIAIDGNQLRTHKVATTPENPAVGSFAGLEEGGFDLHRTDTLLHGSTIATNAVLERRGAVTGLLTTRGFRDVLIIQRFDKKDSYDPFYKRPEPLVPRSRIAEVTERMDRDGKELVPLAEGEVIEAVRRLRDNGIESLAIAFLHAYANPAHEHHARAIVARAFPDLAVTLASDVLPKFREYERTSTTVISAYVKPVVDRYLRAFEDSLDRSGFDGTFLVMQANGGVMPAAGARQHPALMYLSGPAAGVVGAQYVSRRCGLPNLLTFDVGGTSTDVCLITDGQATITAEGEIDRLPISLPLADITSVGAGGGSIAWRDSGGMFRVGPASAGARPGPACYGRGGLQATVTDALVLLGLIPAERFLGGRMRLDTKAAEAAVERVAASFGMPTLEMAESILRVTVANVTQTTRLVSIQRGHDPRRYAICAYGGAGPLLAALLAEELAVQRVVVPVNPGLFSAFGLLVSDFKRDYTRTQIVALSRLSPGELQSVVAKLRQQAEAEFASYGMSTAESVFSAWVDLRYQGQGYELRVPLTETRLHESGTRSLREFFDQVHLARYGHAFPEQDVVAVNWGLTVTTNRESGWRFATPVATTQPTRLPGRIFLGGQWHGCEFYLRHELPADCTIPGPAVMSEDTATTFVPPGWRGRVDAYGNLHLEDARRDG